MFFSKNDKVFGNAYNLRDMIKRNNILQGELGCLEFVLYPACSCLTKGE